MPLISSASTRGRFRNMNKVQNYLVPRGGLLFDYVMENNKWLA